MKKCVDQCQTTVVHQELIEEVNQKMLPTETLYDLAEIFKVFGDTTRIKILYALFQQELCVCDIAVVVGVSQSAISHQLRLLKQARLVKFRKEGKIVYYSLDDEHVKNIFAVGLTHIKEKSLGGSHELL